MTASNRPSWLPRVLAGAAAVAALVAYGVLLLLVPEVLDWAFAEGGKAPLLVAVVGAAVTIGAYLGVERLASGPRAR